METAKNVTGFYHEITYISERNGDYELAAQISSKWQYVNTNPSGNGNQAYEWVYDSETKKIIDRPDGEDRYNERYVDFYKLISSPLALYKCICLFKKMPTEKGNDWYKVVWTYPLKHKATGKFLTLGEFKAGFSFWTEGNLPEEFLNDAKELLEFLVTDKVPHTYDRVSAGSVA